MTVAVPGGRPAARPRARRTCRACRIRGSRGRRPRSGRQVRVRPRERDDLHVEGRRRRARATVRLMPSTAIDPFGMSMGASVAGERERHPGEVGLRAHRRRARRCRRRGPARSARRAGVSARIGAFEVHGRAGRRARRALVTRAVSGPRRRSVSRPPSRRDHGQAHAVDGDALAERGVGRERRSRSRGGNRPAPARPRPRRPATQSVR